MAFSSLIYKVCGALAAAMLCLIAILIISQVFLRSVGHQIPSADDFAAWALSASIFLALPSALMSGSHIRVTSIRNLVRDPYSRVMDIVASLIALTMLGWGSVALVGFVWDSYRFNDVSQGLVAVPLWIPQIAMVIGSVLFTVAMAERVLRLVLCLPVETSSNTIESSEI
jgi:TRAP-type C4-dicarboxylate transport system permease small subunit